MKNTFKKGVHPKASKQATEHKPIEIMPEPQSVHVCLAQHIGKPAQAIVAVGDRVKRGQLIAKADGFVSANIYSPVSGEVKAVDEIRPTVMGKAAHIIIENDWLGEEVRLEPLTNPNGQDIINRVQQAGIVGMGGAGFPTHVKLSPKEQIDTFIINAAECEPFITCDHRVMLEYTEQFVGGALLMAKAVGLDRVYIGVEENKPDAIARLREYCRENGINDVDVVKLKAKYPQGAEKQLIYAITRRKVPAGGLPSAVGCVVDNVQTALATYYAVVEGVPLYKRVMTVTGDGVSEPRNAWVLNGTVYDEVISYCKPKDSVVKLISGGPMMGISVFNSECVTTKTTGCLLLLTAQTASLDEPSACINCSKCAGACPMRLMPMFIDSALSCGDVDKTAQLGVTSCIECGCCSFVCPAKRPLVQAMKLAKKKLKEKK